MIIKALEIRDACTFIPVIAIQMVSIDPREDYLLNRAGFRFYDPCVVLCRMECSGTDRNATYDPYAWGGGSRTMTIAHQYIVDHFYELHSGEVIDVEFILGEKSERKISERDEVRKEEL